MAVKDFQSPTQGRNQLVNNAKKFSKKKITHKVEIERKSKNGSDPEGQNQVKSKNICVSRKRGFSSEVSGNNQRQRGELRVPLLT